jgi:hypothetical protein
MEEERKKDKAQRGSDLLFATGDLCSERPAHGSVRGREGLCMYITSSSCAASGLVTCASRLVGRGKKGLV